MTFLLILGMTTGFSMAAGLTEAWAQDIPGQKTLNQLSGEEFQNAIKSINQPIATGNDFNNGLQPIFENLPPCIPGSVSTQKCRCGGISCGAGTICASDNNQGVNVYWCKNQDNTVASAGSDILNPLQNTDKKVGCANTCAPSCYYSEIQGECLLCGMFKKAFNVSSEVAARSIQTFSGSIMNLVVMVFALWIVVKVLAFVSSPETRDIKDLTQELVQQSFFVVFVIILLKTGGMSFFNMALNPVFQTGMTIAQRTITADDAAGWQAEGSNYSCDRSGILTQKDGGALPEKMGESIVCTMTLIQDRASKIKALGTASICYSWKKKVFVIPHWGYFMTGVGLWVGAVLLILAVPFFMLDSVVQLAVASALLPMAIGAYAFKITRGYVKPVWETFINSMFVFIFVCLIALMLTKAYETVLLSASQGELNLNDMLRAGTEANLEKMLQKFSWFDVAFLKVCFILILSWSVIAEAKSFAGNFSGSLSNTNFGSQIGTMAGSATKSAVKSLTKPTREAIGDAAWEMPARAASGISHYGRRGLMSYQAYKIKKRGSGTVAEDGSKTFTDRRGNTVTEFADGSRSVKTVRSERGFMGLGKKKGEIVKFKNEHFSITRSDVRDKNGNVIGTKERIRQNSSESENLINKKGVLDRERYVSLLNSGQGEMAEMVKIATAKKLAAGQIPNLRINLENHDYVTQTATYDDNGNFTGFMETHRDGSRTIVNLRTAGDRMMTEVTRVSASGQGIRLSTDGIITRKQAFVTDNGKADGNIDESSIRSRYGLTGYYAQQHIRRRYKMVDYNASLFSAEEVTNVRNSMASRTTYNEATLDEFRAY